MSSSAARFDRTMKRLQSKKSHSWWWDSHISPKNCKWLAENLEEMDRSVKQMLKLVEDDGDSFAKKAEMYYQKRPKLITHVEEFYRMYRSLAERYDHLTGELRKNIPSELQSQGSGSSDISLELQSSLPSPATDHQKLSRKKSGPRAAGFDFFLGSGGNGSDISQKEGDESFTLTDSEGESDDSSVNNYSTISGYSGDRELTKKIMELEIEVRETREKLQIVQQQQEHKNENWEDILASRVAAYEEELRDANNRIQNLEEEITRLNAEVLKYKSNYTSNINDGAEERINVMEAENSGRIYELTEELRITKEKLWDSEREIETLKDQLKSNEPSEKVRVLQDQLASAHKEINTWKNKVNAEKREATKLQERISRLKTSLTDRDHEIRDLKIAVSDAEEKIFPEKAQIKSEMSKLVAERSSLEEQVKELESRGRSLEDDIRIMQAEKSAMEERLNSEIKQLKSDIDVRDGHIVQLNKTIHSLKCEKDELNMSILMLKSEIDKMEKHLHQKQFEHAELVSSAKEARNLVDELKMKAKGLEEETERQRALVLEAAEGKREAIRQLCFSLEHYRNDYHRLRQVFVNQKRVPVLAR